VKLFFLLLLLAPIKNVHSETGITVSSGIIHLSTTSLSHFKILRVSGDPVPVPSNLILRDCWIAPCETVGVIDSDGDIFLRGKWIGWDYRLSNQYRKTGKWRRP
jgi:hypothetical protein